MRHLGKVTARRARADPARVTGRGTGAKPRRAGGDGAARPRSHGDAGLRHGGGGLYNVQEALVKVDRHGKIVPWLASDGTPRTNKNYTFFLKRGVRFHNGRELKAADVKFVIDRR